MLEYLYKCHGIFATTIYNDLHGFTKYQDIYNESLYSPS